MEVYYKFPKGPMCRENKLAFLRDRNSLEKGRWYVYMNKVCALSTDNESIWDKFILDNMDKDIYGAYISFQEPRPVTFSSDVMADDLWSSRIPLPLVENITIDLCSKEYRENELAFLQDANSLEKGKWFVYMDKICVLSTDDGNVYDKFILENEDKGIYGTYLPSKIEDTLVPLELCPPTKIVSCGNIFSP